MQKKSLAIPILVFVLTVIILTVFTGKKHGYTVDANASFQITKEIVETGNFFPQTAVKQGYLYSVVYIPFYMLAQPIHLLLPDIPLDMLQRKMLCWMNTIWTGATAGVLCCLLIIVGYPKRVQIVLPLIYSFSTLAFTYARYDYNKSLATFFLISTFYFFVRYILDSKKTSLLFSGVFMALLVCIRLEMAAIVIPFLVGLVLAKRLNTIAYLLIPAALGIAFVLGYNAMYWQANVSGGYEGSFTLNPIPAMIGVLFSPGKSLFVFNPVLLLLPLTLRFFWIKQDQPIRLVWAGTITILFLLYCFWGNWWGGWGYGARHFMPLLPLLILPLAECFSAENKRLLLPLLLLFFVGFIVQFAGAAIAFHDVINTLMQAGISEQQLIWLPQLNPVMQHIQFMQHIPFANWDFAVIPFIMNYSAIITIPLLCGTGGLTFFIGIRLYRLGIDE
jgi:hypothetical protein